MDDKDLCAGGVSALEQRIITMDRLDEIRSYGYNVEKVWECEVNSMLKKGRKCTRCKKRLRCNQEECDMHEFFSKTALEGKVNEFYVAIIHL